MNLRQIARHPYTSRFLAGTITLFLIFLFLWSLKAAIYVFFGFTITRTMIGQTFTYIGKSVIAGFLVLCIYLIFMFLIGLLTDNDNLGNNIFANYMFISSFESDDQVNLLSCIITTFSTFGIFSGIGYLYILLDAKITLFLRRY